jgi:hypothetical protein
VSTFLNPPGTSKFDEETGAWEKFDLCTVVSIKVALVVCVPSEFVVVVVVSDAGCGFFLWKPPSAEPPNADPNIPAIEPLLGEVAAGAGSEFCALAGPVPLPPILVTSITRVP